MSRFNSNGSMMASEGPQNEPAELSQINRKPGHHRGTKNADEGQQGLDKILFEDDIKGGEYLKGLISSAGLKTAWEKLSKRLRLLEEVTGCRKERSEMTVEELARAFASRQECQDIARAEYEERLLQHEKRLDVLEAASKVKFNRFDNNEKDLADIRDTLSKHWDSIEAARKDIVKVEQQDQTYHEEATEMHHTLRSEIVRVQVDAADARTIISHRVDEEKGTRQGLQDALDELKAFLYSAGLQKQLEQICIEMLSQYVSWDEMKVQAEDIHGRAVESATAPLTKDIDTLRSELEENTAQLTVRDSALSNDVEALNEKFSGMNQKLIDRIDDVVIQVNQRAMDTRLVEVEKRGIARDEYMEIDFAEFKELQTRKIEEAYDRVAELESSIFAHEHALEHWAEEIGNRASKYDMMVISSRVEKCALKDKLDQDYKELQKTLKWQSVKIENLTFKTNFGDSVGNVSSGSKRGKKGKPAPRGRSREDEVHTSEDEVGVPQIKPTARIQEEGPGSKTSPDSYIDTTGELIAKSAAAIAASSSTAPPPLPRNGSVLHQTDSELMAMLSQQIESLAQCVLGLSHATLRVAVCGLSREARNQREDRLVFHITSLLHWIQHRAAPKDWDPMELQSLALKVLDDNSKQDRSGKGSRAPSRGSGKESDSPRHPGRLSKADTWQADHLLTNTHHYPNHEDHNIPEALLEHVRRPEKPPIEDPSPVKHQPTNATHRAAERSMTDKEREERRQQQWIEKGASSSTLENMSHGGSQSSTSAPKASVSVSSGGKKRDGPTPKRGAFMRHVPWQTPANASQVSARSSGQAYPAVEATSAKGQSIQQKVMDVFGDQNASQELGPAPPSRGGHRQSNQGVSRTSKSQGGSRMSRQRAPSPIGVAAGEAGSQRNSPELEGGTALPRLSTNNGSTSAR